MKKTQKNNRFYVLLGAILLIVIIAILTLIPIYNSLRLSVSLDTTNPKDQIGPYETLTLTFSQPVIASEVESKLELQPAEMGKLTWQNDHTLRIIPSEPYRGDLSIRLAAGKFAVNGTSLQQNISWTLKVRPVSIVYLSYADPKNELVTLPAEGGATRQLTSTNGEILSFDVAPTGDAIVYSALNDKKASDLWLIDHNGQNTRRLLNCDADYCATPSWSPDGKWIAYSRGKSPDYLPRLWVVDPITAETHAVFADVPVADNGILWSPNGQWLATYNDDEVTTEIHSIELSTGTEKKVPTHSNLLGSWSPDSKFLYHSDFTMDSKGNIIKNSLLRIDQQTGQSTVVLTTGSTENDYRYGKPLVSPNGTYIAVSMRNIRREVTHLWVVRADKPEEAIVDIASGYSYDFYQWDMWEKKLLIQQTGITKAYLYEVAVWDPTQGYKVLTKNAMYPHWLP